MSCWNCRRLFKIVYWFRWRIILLWLLPLVIIMILLSFLIRYLRVKVLSKTSFRLIRKIWFCVNKLRTLSLKKVRCSIILLTLFLPHYLIIHINRQVISPFLIRLRIYLKQRYRFVLIYLSLFILMMHSYRYKSWS